jgi:large subunit ribosomal protein L18
MSVKTREFLRRTRHVRIRKNLAGTESRPRLAVYRSLRHIYAQIIDDQTGRTLVAASSQDKGGEGAANREAARKVGLRLAERAKEQGITGVVFDRGGFQYQGRVASLAEGAREGGLEF